MRKNPDYATLQRNYSPAHWGMMLADAERAYLWPCPMLAQLAHIYAPHCPEDWIDQHITALFLSSASRDSEMAQCAIAAFVPAFAASVAHYKLSELMLFFGRYKAGLYDHSLYAFDPRRIGLSFHSEFLPERRRELALIAQRHEAQQQAREERLRREHAISIGQWQSLSRQATYSVRMRFLVPLDSTHARIICRYLGLPSPPREAELTLRLTRHKARLLLHWQSLRRIIITDSWL